MKDLFSKQAAEYSAFRPLYPQPLYDYLLRLVPSLGAAWDCGTGNGQVAAVLADHFGQVFATDISQQQLSRAVQKRNIIYSLQAAEQTDFAASQFDLITVAQAIHWFRFEDFYREVRRTLKPEGILAVLGYGLIKVDGPLDGVIRHFYSGKIGKYWDDERRYIDENYRTIPFPFEEMETPTFTIEVEWSIDQLAGYLSTWSAVQHYVKLNETNPVDEIRNDLTQAWGGETKRNFRFPVLLRVSAVGKGRR